MSYPQVSIKGSETRVLSSKNTGMKYLISVGMPHLYSDESKKEWPVVYLIDSNLYFGMITDIIRSMSWCGMTRDALVVGIGYASDSPLEEAWHEVMAWRYKDLTPICDEQEEAKAKEWLKREVKSGGAKEFHAFVENELIPMIESNYRVNPKTRTLAGHSFGGLFTLFAMLNRPELFKNYIACSPTVPYRDSHIFEIEESFAARRRKTLPVNLFLSVGELEEYLEDPMVSEMYRFANHLESRGYQRFDIQKRLFPGEDHCTVIAPSFQAGLKLVLKV